MRREDLTGQRAIAIFILAAVGFSPVFISIFSGPDPSFVLGIPVLVLYLFLAWGLVVLAIAVNVYRSGSGHGQKVKQSKRRGTGASGGYRGLQREQGHGG